MADYRDISQQYAQGAIKACILLNAGAAVAVLSQSPEIIPITSTFSLRNAVMFWVTGTAIAAFGWVFGFLSTRYVDKSERETDLAKAHLRRSDFHMYAGLATVIISMLIFLIGSIVLATGLKPTLG